MSHDGTTLAVAFEVQSSSPYTFPWGTFKIDSSTNPPGLSATSPVGQDSGFMALTPDGSSISVAAAKNVLRSG